MKIDQHDFDEIIAIVKEGKPGRIEVTRGCNAARNGGCACMGWCRDVVGFYENGQFTTIKDVERKLEVGFSSYPLNTGIPLSNEVSDEEAAKKCNPNLAYSLDKSVLTYTFSQKDKNTIMEYTKISPLGPRVGPGTFDFVFDTEKYKMDQAIIANDGIIVDFVKGNDGILYFDAYDTKQPDIHEYLRLQIQHFPFGIDMMDDAAGFELGCSLLRKRPKQ